MKFIDKILKQDADYCELLDSVTKNRLPLVCTGLSLIHKAVTTAALVRHTGKKAVLVTHDESSAAELKDDLSALGVRAVNFPSRDLCIGDLHGYSREYEHKRTDTLSALADGDFDVLTVSLDAAIQYTVSPEKLGKKAC